MPLEAAAIAGLASAAASLGGGVMNIGGNISANKTNLKIAREQMQWNEKMMDKENAFNVQMRDEDREYQDPKAQIERLRNAGLNPLFYGVDHSGSGAVPVGASANTASLPHVDNPMAGGSELIANGVAQAALTKAQVENLEADTKKKEEDTLGARIENEIKSKTKGNVVQLSGLNVELTKGEIERQQKEIAQIQAKTEQINQDIKNSLRDLDIKEREVKCREIANEIARFVAENDYSIEQKKIAVAWYNARVQESGVKANNVYLELQGDKVKLDTGHYDKVYEVEEQFLEFNGYVGAANGVIDAVGGVASAVLSGASAGKVAKGLSAASKAAKAAGR